ncbi:MAG TPA: hypothetical protein VH092_33415 [Urbifossiella sp.]|jgi:hypothetical protein|nr:hypothetical protein [Urbifossiella sp.]
MHLRKPLLIVMAALVLLVFIVIMIEDREKLTIDTPEKPPGQTTTNRPELPPINRPEPRAETKESMRVGLPILADESLTPEEYIELGMPAHDRVWGSRDMATAADILRTLSRKGSRVVVQ